MVKRKQNSISDGEWKDLRVRKQTANRLMIYKVNNDLLTYDQAIVLLLDKIEGVFYG
jgi:hypothetical protein